MMEEANIKSTNYLLEIIKSDAVINSISVDSEGRNALFVAVVNGREAILIRLLSAGGDVQWRDIIGRTLLMHAMSVCEEYELTKFADVEDSSIGCVKVLLKAGVDVNAQDKDGKTALMYAADKVCVSERVKLLIAAGADANLTDKDGRTALMVAADMDKFCRDCTRESDKPARCDNIVRQLIPVTADIDIQDNNKNNALLIASANHFVACALRLVENGANVNVRDRNGMTPLLHCTYYHGDNAVTELASLLIQEGADVNAQDKDGMTPLMFAVRCRHEEVFNLLLSNCANVEQTDNQNRTALIQLIVDVNGEYATSTMLANLLTNTTNYVFEKEFHPMIQTLIPEYEVEDICEHPIIAHFLIRNGFTNFKHMWYYQAILRGIPKHTPFFSVSLTLCENLLLPRFLLAISFVFQSDFELLKHDHFRYRMITYQGSNFINDVLSNPWPLVKLCFIVVSSKIGISPGREQRIRQTELPRNIQECLLFQRPIADLPVHHWQNIPLTFNPTEYEHLPAPYPLLYNWPFGRRLVTCYCENCKGRRLNFEGF